MDKLGEVLRNGEPQSRPPYKGKIMYYYEHTNGKIISKPDFVVETGTTPEEYFNSDFVVRWWKEED